MSDENTWNETNIGKMDINKQLRQEQADLDERLLQEEAERQIATPMPYNYIIAPGGVATVGLVLECIALDLRVLRPDRTYGVVFRIVEQGTK